MELQRLGLTPEVLLMAVGCGVAAVVTLLLARRLLAWLLGPIFVYETLRLARKGHTFWLRTAWARPPVVVPHSCDRYRVRAATPRPWSLRRQARASARCCSRLLLTSGGSWS